MTDQILEYLEYAAHLMSLVAVVVIVVGFALAACRYAVRFHHLREEADFQAFKVDLGSALTMGLEILVLSDMIDTITTEPTFMSLGMLAFLVVVRTALSWTLSLEIEGHWPWQSSPEKENPSDDTAEQHGKELGNA